MQLKSPANGINTACHDWRNHFSSCLKEVVKVPSKHPWTSASLLKIIRTCRNYYLPKQAIVHNDKIHAFIAHFHHATLLLMLHSDNHSIKSFPKNYVSSQHQCRMFNYNTNIWWFTMMRGCHIELSQLSLHLTFHLCLHLSHLDGQHRIQLGILSWKPPHLYYRAYICIYQ